MPISETEYRDILNYIRNTDKRLYELFTFQLINGDFGVLRPKIASDEDYDKVLEIINKWYEEMHQQ